MEVFFSFFFSPLTAPFVANTSLSPQTRVGGVYIPARTRRRPPRFKHESEGVSTPMLRRDDALPRHKCEDFVSRRRPFPSPQTRAPSLTPSVSSLRRSDASPPSLQTRPPFTPDVTRRRHYKPPMPILSRSKCETCSSHSDTATQRHRPFLAPSMRQ
jgi:hypothetical protein